MLRDVTGTAEFGKGRMKLDKMVWGKFKKHEDEYTWVVKAR